MTVSRKSLKRFGERGRNRSFNLLIKSQPVLSPQFSRNYPIHQQLTISLARTEKVLEMLETLAMFSNVQPHLQPHPLIMRRGLRMRFLEML